MANCLIKARILKFFSKSWYSLDNKIHCSISISKKIQNSAPELNDNHLIFVLEQEYPQKELELNLKSSTSPGNMDLMTNNMQQQRKMVEQLRREANVQRIPVSQACADIVKYVTEHEPEDCLLVGFSSQKVNPFREKSSCQII